VVVNLSFKVIWWHNYCTLNTQKIEILKKILWTPLLAILVVVAGALSCKKVIKTIFPGLDVNLSEVRIEVPINPFAPPVFSGELPTVRISQAFNLDSLIKANTLNQFGVGDVTSVKLKEMTINLENTNQNNNLKNFEYIKIGFSSSTNRTVAEIITYNFPDLNATSASINGTNSPELVTYLNGRELYYDVTIKPRYPTTQKMVAVIKAVVSVK
jgi:hypothetical protein